MKSFQAALKKPSAALVLSATASLGLVVPTIAMAVPENPVREVMEVTVSNWSGETAGEDLFSRDRLERIFSADFKALYEEAMQDDWARDAGTPFDYDVVVNAQDGCPLRNVTISPAEKRDGSAHVDVRFRFLTCLGETAEYQAWSRTTFVTVHEDGKDRIDDIIATNPDGMTLSAKDQLKAITAK